jgi:outer membrane protein assembly factor BamE (lipoprotein component of BamABCDE complex)
MRKRLTALVFLLLSGCAGTPFEWEKARQVKIGTTEADVVALMGKPFAIRGSPGGAQR